jgi:hypothetical protein
MADIKEYSLPILILIILFSGILGPLFYTFYKENKMSVSFYNRSLKKNK